MDLREECRGAKKIGISGHIRPDGDCVGVCLSLRMYLRKLLPEAEVIVYLQKPSEEFSYLKGYDEIQTECLEQDPFDVYFALDCSGDRLGDAEKYFQNAKKKINIDHHISNSGCGDVNLVRPEVGSACEVLYHIMDAELIDRDIAEALYTGIIHDTGVFQYSNTTPETLQAAAFLISFGFNFPKLIEESFYQKTYLQTQIMGRALMESIRFMDATAEVGGWFKKVFIRAELFGVRGFPVGAFWLLGFFIIAALILHKTKFGRYVYAIGSNEEATRLSGIKVDNWKVAVYTLSGFFIGMCALFYAAAYTTITPGTGAGQEMNGITGVIIGGTSMSGGSGTMVGTLIGVFIMSVLKTGLANCGLQAPWQTFLTGAVVIGAVLLDIARTKAANRVKKG